LSLFNVAASMLLASTANCPTGLEKAATVQLAPVNQAPEQVVIIPQTAQLQLSNTIAPASINPLPDKKGVVQLASDPNAPVSAVPDSTAAPTNPQLNEPVVAVDPANADANLPPVDGDEILVTAKRGPPPGDPAEAVNEVSFAVVQAVDENLIAPIAQGYQKGIPSPIRRGLHNVLNNLDEPIVFVNFLLQLKIGKAFETAGRFVINSTLGVAGIIDVAKKKPFNLPRRSNGLADTLGYYGVGPGPYLFLPLIGSTSVRDLLGRVVDLSILPTAVGNPFAKPVVTITKGALSSLDDRVENNEILTRIQQSDNPYAAAREYYLTKRQAEIDVLKGKRCDSDINLDELKLLSKKVPETTAPEQSETH
jgi:phospholipid-binding lipoprotein MlaA